LEAFDKLALLIACIHDDGPLGAAIRLLSLSGAEKNEKKRGWQ
jgi:hypothetical protein